MSFVTQIKTFLAANPEAKAVVYGAIVAAANAVLGAVPATFAGYGILVAAVTWIDGRFVVKTPSPSAANPNPSQVAVPTPTPTLDGTPKPVFNLSWTGTVGVNNSIVINVSGGTPNSQYMLYEAGVPQTDGAVLGQPQQLDANGNDKLVYVLRPASVILDLIQDTGSAVIFALDSEGLISPTVTIQ